MSRTIRIMLAGVGGQGTILAARIISEAAAASSHGYDVNMSEIHGMAQRGGSVVSHVAFGHGLHSPLPEPGTVSYLVAFEKLEGLRSLAFAGPESLVIVNRHEILPMTVLTGSAEYPADIMETFRQAPCRVIDIDAAAAARRIGVPQVQNLVLVGALALQPGLDDLPWLDTIRLLVKPEFLNVNLEAFETGRCLAAIDSSS